MRLFVSWLVASQSFASLHFALSMISTCASKSFKPVLPHESTISTYMRYFCAVLSKFVCAVSNFKINFSFVCSYCSRGSEGWPIFSMLRCVILMMSVYSLVIAREQGKGIRDAQSRNEKNYFTLSNNKFHGKCWYGRHPWIRLAMESESMVEKGINFISVWEPPMIYLAWKVLGTTRSFSLTGKACHPKCFISIFFTLSYSTSTNPYFHLRTAFLLLLCNFFYLSLHLLL